MFLLYHTCVRIAKEDRKSEQLCESLLEKTQNLLRMSLMKTFYDVQQFLKRFGIVVYMGKRLYDIELMKLELSRIYDAGLMDKLDYLEAEAVLRREHKVELDYIEKNGEKN